MRAALVALSLLAIAAPAIAAAPPELRIPLDVALPLRLASPAQGVAIGNPSIAGVTVQSDRLLFITGKSYGSTNLLVVGPSGETVLETKITVLADEENAVFLSRGAQMERYDCTPVCRRRPDLSDAPDALSAIAAAITGRNGGGQ